MYIQTNYIFIDHLLAFLACAILPQFVTLQELMELVNVGRFSNQWKLSWTFASDHEFLILILLFIHNLSPSLYSVYCGVTSRLHNLNKIAKNADKPLVHLFHVVSTHDKRVASISSQIQYTEQLLQVHILIFQTEYPGHQYLGPDHTINKRYNGRQISPLSFWLILRSISAICRGIF